MRRSDQPDRPSLTESREYAWSWFALHAGQRMQHMNHFFAASAFLFVGHGVALHRDDVAALVIALLGFLSTLAFHRLELRTRELVKLGEKALGRIEDELASHAGIDEIRLVALADCPERRFIGTYRQGIAVIQWGVGMAFLGGTLLAILRLWG